MQTSNQSPQEEHQPDRLLRSEPDRLPLPLSTSDERPAEHISSRPATQATPEYDEEAEEAILKGVIYPPPPEFYAKHRPTPPPVQPAPQRIQTVAMPAAGGVGHAGHVGQNPSGPSAPLYPARGAYFPAGPVPQYGPYPGYMPYARRPSYAWIWWVGALLITLILAACGIFAWLSYSMFGTAARNLNEATSAGPQVANAYYSALQAQDYQRAYSYLHPTGSLAGLTLEQFTAQAQQRDTQYGTIQTYQTGELTLTAQGNQAISGFRLPVNLERSKGEKYTTHLVVQKIKNTWKIIAFDYI